MLLNPETVAVAGSRQHIVLSDNDRKSEEDVVGRTRERGPNISARERTQPDPELRGGPNPFVLLTSFVQKISRRKAGRPGDRKFPGTRPFADMWNNSCRESHRKGHPRTQNRFASQWTPRKLIFIHKRVIIHKLHVLCFITSRGNQEEKTRNNYTPKSLRNVWQKRLLAF
jgi:hypothetical protein